jgi:hypothetical protein
MTAKLPTLTRITVDERQAKWSHYPVTLIIR